MGTSLSQEMISNFLQEASPHNCHTRFHTIDKFIRSSTSNVGEEVNLNELAKCSFRIGKVTNESSESAKLQLERRLRDNFSSASKNVDFSTLYFGEEESPSERLLFLKDTSGKFQLEHTLFTVILREILDGNHLSPKDLKEQYLSLLKHILSKECPHNEKFDPFIKMTNRIFDRYEERLFIYDDAISYIVYNFPTRLDVLVPLLNFIQSRPKLVKKMRSYVFSIDKQQPAANKTAKVLGGGVFRRESILQFYTRHLLFKEFDVLLQDYEDLVDIEHRDEQGHNVLMTIVDACQYCWKITNTPYDDETNAKAKLRTTVVDPEVVLAIGDANGPAVALHLLQTVISHSKITPNMLRTFGNNKETTAFLTPFFYAIQRGSAEVVGEFLVSKLTSVRRDFATNWRYWCSSDDEQKLGGTSVIRKLINHSGADGLAPPQPERAFDDTDDDNNNSKGDDHYLMNTIHFAAEQLRHDVLPSLLAQPGANEAKHCLFDFVVPDEQGFIHLHKANALTVAIWSAEGKPYGQDRNQGIDTEIEGLKTVHVLWINGCRKVVSDTVSGQLRDLTEEEKKKWQLQSL